MDREQKASLAEKLRSSLLFRYLDDSSLDQIIDLSDLVHYNLDEKIIEEGDLSTCLYTIVDGTVNVFIQEKSGKDIFVGAIGAGDIFREARIFQSIRRTARIVS